MILLCAVLTILGVLAAALLLWPNPDRRSGLETEWDDPVPDSLRERGP